MSVSIRKLFAPGFSLLGIFVIAFPSPKAHAIAYRRDVYHDIEFLGRGNAGIASVNSGAAAFYNPAGLANSNVYRLEFVTGNLAANQYIKESVTEIRGISGSGTTLADKMSPFLGKPLALDAAAFPHVMTPNFLFGAFDYFDSTFQYRDPVNPELDLDLRNDYGLVFGAAKSFANRVYVGASMRYIRRRHALQDLTAGALLQDASGVIKGIQARGEGWGLNLGAQFRQPISDRQEMMYGLTVEDVGQTSFRNIERTAKPMKQYQTINAGITYGVTSPAADVKISFDMRNLADSTNLSYTKRLYSGVEVELPIADVRAGLYQGYWTAGFTVHVLPLLTIDVATYAEEIGVIAGQRQNRYFMLGMRLGTELKPRQTKKQKLSLDNL